MCTQDELYRLGQKVDHLQQLNYQATPFSNLVLNIAEIETLFTNVKDSLGDDIDSSIVFSYTRANYLFVLTEIAQSQGATVCNSPPYSQYKTAGDFIYDCVLQRMTLLRTALKMYEDHSNSKISNIWMNQVRVNLANLYTEIGRIVEALEILDPIKDSFGMARLNYAAKLYRLSSFTSDEQVQKELLIAAQFYYSTTINDYAKGKECDSIPEDIFDAICMEQKDIAYKLERKYKNIPTICDVPEDTLNDLGIEFSNYKSWCKDSRLILSIRNLFQAASVCDDLHLPNMGIGYFAHDHSLSYYSWFNTLKQEYNQARYFLYLTENVFHNYSDSVHESQETILLVNTMDYPAIGYHTELLKCSLKTAYGVLDKIGLLCNDFIQGKNFPVKKINFMNWFQGIENNIRINDEFTPLYWVAKDLSISGSFAIFRKLRNIIEHRYLRVVEHTTITLEKELEDMDKMEYCISFSDLQQQAHEILRLIRALLFYVIFAFHGCYLKTIQVCEKEHKAFIPLAISFYDDEWKN